MNMKKKFTVRMCAAAIAFAAAFAASAYYVPADIAGYSFAVSAESKSTALKAPKNVKASKVTENSCVLKCDEVSGADGYLIYRYNSSSKKYELYTFSETASCTVEYLAKGTKYRFKTAAFVYDYDEPSGIAEGRMSAVTEIKTKGTFDSRYITLPGVDEKIPISAIALSFAGNYRGDNCYSTGKVSDLDGGNNPEKWTSNMWINGKINNVIFLPDFDKLDYSKISKLKNLVYLDMHSIYGETDKSLDLSFLSGLKKLRYLEISDNNISDITPLLNLKNLKYLAIYSNNISNADIEKLKKALPGCVIIA